MMSWEEFIDRYINNFEEFVFKYNDYRIELLYGSQGNGFVYYLVQDKRVVDTKLYDSPNDLLEDFTVSGLKLKDIWEEIEWK